MSALSGYGQVLSEAQAALVATAEELVKKTSDVYQRAEKDGTLHSSDELDGLIKQHGPAYKKLLVEQFRSADNVTITEISHPMDFDPPNGQNPDELPKYKYASVQLTEEQKKLGLEALQAMDDTSRQGVLRCGFSPHHLVDMVNNGMVSQMLVCFECATSEWHGSLGLNQPSALNDTLGVIVEAAGLQKTKPWKKMAQERRAKDAERKLEMAPEEVMEKMEKLHKLAVEDKTETIRESAEYRKLSEALPLVFRTLLSRRIREADHITITEISSYGDFIPLVHTVAKFTDLPEYEYASKRVTPEQQALAAKTAETMDLSYPEPNYCGPMPHHRMDITGKDGKVSTLLICYECLSVQWEEFPSLSETNGFWAVMNPMMKQVGLEAKKDWGKMAMDRYAKETAKNKSPDEQAPAK
ncbi:MAG: hypothetical protein EOP84_23225 [Verrucomicrobiaceae bacterium]|nr:MAG: hypothetical protein EOP84_23225 [Verrucomicrobiaceae bacterium]